MISASTVVLAITDLIICAVVPFLGYKEGGREENPHANPRHRC